MRILTLILALVFTAHTSLAATGKESAPKREAPGVEHPVAKDYMNRLDTMGMKIDPKGMSAVLKANSQLAPLYKAVFDAIGKEAARKNIEADRPYFTELISKVDSIAAMAAKIRSDAPTYSTISPKAKELLQAMEIAVSLIREAAEGGATADRVKIDATLDLLKVSKEDIKNDAVVEARIKDIEAVLRVSITEFINRCLK